jgi:hypothetical protein
MIPKFTSPQVKFIRTGEGILVYLFNGAMIIIPLLSSSLSPVEALKWAGVVNAATVISRSGLKALTAFAGMTGIKPDVVQQPAGISDDAKQLLAYMQKDPHDLHLHSGNVETQLASLLETFPDSLEWISKTVKDVEEFKVVPAETDLEVGV